MEHAIATSGALGGTGAGKDSFGNGPQAKTVASARIKGPATDKTAVKAIEQGMCRICIILGSSSEVISLIIPFS